MRPVTLSTLAVLALGPALHAQCFNIDVGVVGTRPTSAYGATGQMAGYWNDLVAAPASVSLIDTEGVATCVTISAVTNGGTPAGGSFPFIAGADGAGALFNDYASVPTGATTTWTISGLASGEYQLIVYSVSPLANNATLLTCLTFPAPTGKLLCGAWDGSGLPDVGTGYVSDTRVLSAPDCDPLNTLMFTSSAAPLQPNGCVNAIQIVKLDTGRPGLYCTSGVSNFGCVPIVTIDDPNPPSADAHDDGFSIHVTAIDGQKAGIFFYGANGTIQAPWCVGAGSFMCVKSPVKRMLGSIVHANTGGTVGQCDGFLSVDFNLWRSGGFYGPSNVGDQVWLQTWYRDPSTMGGCTENSNLSAAVHFMLEP